MDDIVKTDYIDSVSTQHKESAIKVIFDAFPPLSTKLSDEELDGEAQAYCDMLIGRDEAIKKAIEKIEKSIETGWHHHAKDALEILKVAATSMKKK